MTEQERNQLRQYIKSVMIYDEQNHPISDNFSREIKDLSYILKLQIKTSAQPQFKGFMMMF